MLMLMMRTFASRGVLVYVQVHLFMGTSIEIVEQNLICLSIKMELIKKPLIMRSQVRISLSTNS